MPISFQLQHRLAGFNLTTAQKGEAVQIRYRELLGPTDLGLTSRLAQLQNCLFSHIPDFPNSGVIDHIAVVIHPDLSGHAYINELRIVAKARPNRAVAKGEPVYLQDLTNIEEIDLGIDIPTDSALVIIRSFNWNRSLFYDFGPLHQDLGPRAYPLEKALAQQALLLFGLPVVQPVIQDTRSRLDAMEYSLQSLTDLLKGGCDQEGEYQVLLADNPWMLADSYSQVARHRSLDDENIPDFTALRSYDLCHDILELKQPFTPLFRKNGSFSAEFNDAWNQAERYLDFCHHERSYLLKQKKLRFESPRCILIIGYELSDTQRDDIRKKEFMNRLITVLTYDQLIKRGRHILDLVATAGDSLGPADIAR